MSDLPGAELIAAGTRDLECGRVTAEALVVRLVRARLEAAGYLTVPADDAAEIEAGPQLYRLLAEQVGDGAHSRYNALVRRAVSFCRAVERETAR